MIRELIVETVKKGYHILYNGEPKKVVGNINEYLQTHIHEKSSIYIFSELLNMTDEELNILISK
ncbi:hypothetical protein [Sphingobacterium bovistauri]|uniref:Transposase n=1 Tax=Sphingobacterium bovistauri TaxID=2781959 RepID=A0ABS7Z7Y3_9SPHI|nr:hypothetical protein [Sphingobacterium bovistauri]MCA5006300.1 hypothetical protein [Sphingobacterium bovistauri]